MYQKGDEVLRCAPFSYTVRAEILPHVCDFCLQTTYENPGNSFNLKKCTGEEEQTVFLTFPAYF